MPRARTALPVPTPSHTPGWLAGAIIGAVILLAYANSMGVPFVFDDELSIVQNPTLARVWTAWWPPTGDGITVSGRPLLNVSFAINRAMSGSAVWSYHAVNLVIHAAAALLLYSVVAGTLRRLPAASRCRGRASLLALATAVLWAVHPLQTESVTYVVQRAESLCALLMLLALAAFLRAADASPAAARRWRAVSVAAALAGAFTKETMAVVPLWIALYDGTFVAGNWRGVWQRRTYYAALASTWFITAGLVLATGARGGTFAVTSLRAWWRYDLTQFVAVTHYLRLAVWPWPLCIDYGTFWVGHMAEIAPAVAVVATASLATIAAWRRCPAVGFAGASFFLLLAPSTLAPGTIQMVVEHRMYLPLAPLLVLIVLGLDRAVGRLALPALAAGAAALALTTAARNTEYATPVRLFETTVANRPHNARAMALLADYYRRSGRPDDARRWLEQSLRIEPNVVPVLNNLGSVWQELGQPARAVTCFETALARQPNDIALQNNLGTALILAGRDDDGLARLAAAVKSAPGSTATRLNLAKAYALAGRMPEAAAEFAIVVTRQPVSAGVHAAYAAVLQQLGRQEQSIAEWRRAVGLAPADARLHGELGMALGRAGQLRLALAEFETALRLNPADEVARHNAAVARQRLGLN